MERRGTAFDILKEKLSMAPVLNNPDYTKHFIIQSDASMLDIGLVLSKKNKEAEEVPVAYFSQKLNKAQSNYSVTELIVHM